MAKVKICGITNLEDARTAARAGADALGFVFYKKSPRYIKPENARKIIKLLPKNMIKVGVFVNTGEKRIKEIAKLCRLDMLQFHGNESPGFCQRFKGYKIIKAFRIKNRVDLAKISKYKTFAYLFDTFSESKPGGTGEKFNWQLIRNNKAIRPRIFLSGGLNIYNVKKAIEVVHPHWVDISSSLEIKPGKKNPKKIREFMQKFLPLEKLKK